VQRLHDFTRKFLKRSIQTKLFLTMSNLTPPACRQCKQSNSFDLFAFRACGHVFCQKCLFKHFTTDMLRVTHKGGIPREFKLAFDRFRPCPECKAENTRSDIWDKPNRLTTLCPSIVLRCCGYCGTREVSPEHLLVCPYRRISCPFGAAQCEGLVVGTDPVMLRDQLDMHLRDTCTMETKCEEEGCSASGMSVSAMLAHRERHAFQSDVDIIKRNIGMLIFGEWPMLHGKGDLSCALRQLANEPIKPSLDAPRNGAPEIVFDNLHGTKSVQL
jgi:hypothetical protein